MCEPMASLLALYGPEDHDLFLGDVMAAVETLIRREERISYSSIGRLLGIHRTTVAMYCEDVFSIDIRQLRSDVFRSALASLV